MTKESLFKSLPTGNYIAHSNLTAVQVRFNGGFVGEAKAVCKLKGTCPWVVFRQNNKIVYECNGYYALVNFKFDKIKKRK